MSEKRFLMMVRIGEVPRRSRPNGTGGMTASTFRSALSIPGFISARRYKAVENEYNILIRTGPRDEIQECPRRYITSYELSRLDVLSSQPYLELRDREASLPPNSFEAVTVRLPDFHLGLYEQIYPEPGDYRRPETRYNLRYGARYSPRERGGIQCLVQYGAHPGLYQASSGICRLPPLQEGRGCAVAPHRANVI